MSEASTYLNGKPGRDFPKNGLNEKGWRGKRGERGDGGDGGLGEEIGSGEGSHEEGEGRRRKGESEVSRPIPACHRASILSKGSIVDWTGLFQVVD